MKIDRLILSIAGPLIFLASCAKDSAYTLNSGLAASSIISFSSIIPDSVFADSASTMTIRVNVNPQTDSVEMITLTTTDGSINGQGRSATVVTNLDRYVDFVLKAGQVPGPVLLRATVLTTNIADTVISFATSYPDTVILQVSSNLAKNTSATFSVNLLRYSGYPSVNQKIVFSALDSTGAFQGSFTALAAFSPGNPYNVTYTPSTNFAGHIKLQASVIKTDGTMIQSIVSTVNLE
jgi:hypothetical protein